jgi:large subunit ribosomal protein L13
MKPKTTSSKSITINRRWHLVDLSGKFLGRSCTQIAQLLVGKGKPDFAYHVDNGDYVVVINAQDVRVTGKKAKQKLYHHYTGYAGNLRTFSFKELMAKDPALVIHHGVYGMIPKNRLRDRRIARLKIFAGPTHPYSDKFNK